MIIQAQREVGGMSVGGQRQIIETKLSGTLGVNKAHRVLSLLVANPNQTDSERLRLEDLETALFAHYSRLIRYLVRRYFNARRSAQFGLRITEEDIEQVGRIGFLKALRRFDPERGVCFSTYAAPTILGEIRRWYRDDTWLIRVPRGLRELNYKIMSIWEERAAFLGREPTATELAQATGASIEKVLSALTLGLVYHPVSLDDFTERSDGKEERLSPYDCLGADDPELQRVEDRLFVKDILRSLPEGMIRDVFRQHFCKGLSKAEIARRTGYSQVQIGRWIRAALSILRTKLSYR